MVAGAGVALGGCQPSARNRSAAATAAESQPPASLPANRVVVVKHPATVAGGKIDADAVDALLEQALAKLSPAGDAGAALKALFQPSGVVAINVN